MKNLQLALNKLFSEYSVNGFWSSKERRIIETLTFNSRWEWQYVPIDKLRYSVFCISNILMAKKLYGLNTEEFDDKIQDFIHYVYINRDRLKTDELSYGGLTSLLLGKIIYKPSFIEISEIEKFFDNTLEKVLSNYDNQDSLILIAGKYLNDLVPNEGRLDKLQNLTDRYLNSQCSSGFFETGDLRANYHQRNMYVLWGLSFAASFYPEKSNDIKSSIENTIRWVWNNKRRGKDDAFYWHPSFYWIKNKSKLKVPVYNPKSSKFLFECHQTFFTNAVSFFQYRFKSTQFEEEKTRSMAWIFGQNRIKKNLIDFTGIDLPIRIMDIDGKLFIKGQQFKGSYEIGSYILALAADDYFTKTK